VNDKDRDLWKIDELDADAWVARKAVFGLVRMGVVQFEKCVREGLIRKRTLPRQPSERRGRIVYSRADIVSLKTEDGLSEDEIAVLRTTQEAVAKFCSEVSRKANKSKTPEQRSEASRKANAAMTPEQRSARGRKGNAALTPEQRSAAARKSNASRTPEQLSAAAKKANAALTPEQRSARARKRQAARTPEQRSEAVKKANAGRTFEQRSASAKKREAGRRAAVLARAESALDALAKIGR
jgi:hypothetical protein